MAANYGRTCRVLVTSKNRERRGEGVEEVKKVPDRRVGVAQRYITRGGGGGGRNNKKIEYSRARARVAYRNSRMR